MHPNRQNFRVTNEIGVAKNTMVTSDFRSKVEILACAMHPATIIGTVHLSWLSGRYHVPQNAFLVTIWFLAVNVVAPSENIRDPALMRDSAVK